MRKMLCIICIAALVVAGFGMTKVKEKAEELGYITELQEYPDLEIIRISLPEANKYNRSALMSIGIKSSEKSSGVYFIACDADYISPDQLENSDSIPFKSIPPTGTYAVNFYLKGNVEKDNEGKYVFTSAQREQIDSILTTMLEKKEFFGSDVLSTQAFGQNVRIISSEALYSGRYGSYRLDLCFDVSSNKAYRVVLFPGSEGYVNITTAGIEEFGETAHVTNHTTTTEGSLTWDNETLKWNISSSILNLILQVSTGDYSNFGD